MTLEATADSVTQAGIASVEEVEAARSSLADFVTDPGAVLADPRVFQCWARRPAA